ncbi:hypothetical protein [Methylophaga sp.]|uniref:hypothetical protein n=1 Tax=Methylophaga sp. TaxID=2024840 RepID=UPI003A8F37E8
MDDPELTSEAVDLAAFNAAEMGSNWKPYLYEQVSNGLLITGCYTRPKMSGKNKGKPMFLTKEGRKSVIVTSTDIENCKAELIAATK